MNPALPMQLLEQLAVLPGTGLGYRQPLCFGRLRVLLPPGVALAPVREMVCAALKHPPVEPQGSVDPLLWLVEWLLSCVMLAQQRARVPVFESGRVVGQRLEPDASTVFNFAMPWMRAGASDMALRTLAEIVGRLLSMPAAALSEAAGRAPVAKGVEAEVVKLVERLKPHRVAGNNTYRFLKAAYDLDIPFQPVVANIFAFGQGMHTRWLDSSFSDRTSVVGSQVVRNKHLAAQVLRNNGFPVPDHQLADDGEHAVRIASAFGYPVVVKPADQDGGKGVAAGLRDDEAVRAAYARAREHSSKVLVERHLPGEDFRLTIANGQMVKAVRRVPGGVAGDGLHDVETLIELANAMPRRARRNEGRGAVLLTLDDEALAMLSERGLSPGDVPALDEFVVLRRRANVSSGGEPQLVTQLVHPDNRHLAERAALTLRLDLAGVDLIMADISQSWLDIGAGICEVNAQPQIGDGTTPTIYAELLRGMLPTDGRIPVVLVISSHSAITDASLARKLQGEFEGRGLHCAIASAAGVWLAGPELVCLGGDFYKAARAAMAMPKVAAAVLVASALDLGRSGLPFDRCHAVVLDAWQSAAGDGQAELQSVLRMVLPNVADCLVLGSSDPALAMLAGRLEGSRLRVVEATAGDDGPQRLQRLAMAAMPPAVNLAMHPALAP